MTDKPVDVQTMLRRALEAQLEMGDCDVIIGNRVSETDSRRPPEESEKIGIVCETNDMFEQVQPKGPAVSRFDSIESHRQAICDCQLCPLGKTRNKFVYGAGSSRAGLMFIGEAPGADEDLKGEPFVGRAGQLLDRILAAIGLSRNEVYIANILKCRPPGNRDPQTDEMAQCFGHLKEQVALIKPRLICGLGRIAAQALLKTSTPLGKLRGRWHEYEGVPMLVTYHPAALLRFPAYKKDTWADMQMLKARYDELVGQ